MYRDIATSLAKRAAASVGNGNNSSYELPTWSLPLLLLTLLVFLPFFLFITYTLNQLYPTLAMIEDPSPPAYEPLSVNDDGQLAAEGVLPIDEDVVPTSNVPITASLRRTYRTVYALGGFRSLFRGFWCNFFVSIATSFVAGIFLISGIPSFITIPIVGLVLVQPFAAWTHIVISSPSPKYFFQRFPPFKRTFQATALPMLVALVAAELSGFLTKGVAVLLNISQWQRSQPTNVPQVDKHDAWKALVVIIVGLACQVFLVIPTQVILVRVQASFLPEEDDTVVPFDRSFGGKVEPAIVGGKGYISMIDAWKSFSRASWIRLVKLYAKVFGATVALGVFFGFVAVPLYLLIISHARKIESGDL
ncbi:ubiquitin carrier protein [Xylariaceae sp. FL0255]|nr:ubiquitin carrier protein [Xylariaceae sp. FL0255]